MRIKGKLKFNDYGGTFGGPLLRNRLFFFGGVEVKTLDRQENPTRRTVPALAELNGDFSARSGITLRDPVTGQPFPGNIIPQDRITTDGRAIANAYRAMIERAASVHEYPDREQFHLSARLPVRLAPGDAADRLPAQ